MHPWESDHFKNGRFFNPGVSPQRPWAVLKWLLDRKPGPWQKCQPSEPAAPPVERVHGSDLAVTFVNHSTVLIQTEGQNILTDPIWSERASPLAFLGPKRHREPGIAFHDLPPIDILLVSHNHYDHLDVPTLRKLRARGKPTVFCPLGVARLLRKIGFQQVHELDWWQTTPLGNMQVHCVPAQHFSARTPFDRDRTLWCGWLLEPAGGSIYFAGDTGFGAHFSAIQRKFNSIRLALLPIGAYKPEWFMSPIHMGPEEAIEAHKILDPTTSIAIHFGTFALADDGQLEATDRLSASLGRLAEPSRMWILKEGERRIIPAVELRPI